MNWRMAGLNFHKYCYPYMLGHQRHQLNLLFITHTMSESVQRRLFNLTMSGPL